MLYEDNAPSDRSILSRARCIVESTKSLYHTQLRHTKSGILCASLLEGDQDSRETLNKGCYGN